MPQNKYDTDLGPIEEAAYHIGLAQAAAKKIKHVGADDLLSELNDAEHECDMLECQALEASNEEQDRLDEEKYGPVET